MTIIKISIFTGIVNIIINNGGPEKTTGLNFPIVHTPPHSPLGYRNFILICPFDFWPPQLGQVYDISQRLKGIF